MGFTAQSRVYESDVRLRPLSNCLECHGKGKAALRRGQEPGKPTKSDCLFYTDCHEMVLSPESVQLGDYRLETSDPLHDLKRWVTTPNQRLSGEPSAIRAEDIYFVARASRFEEKHLAECILWAVEEIKQFHFKVRLEVKYLGEKPYIWTFFQSPIRDATPLHKLPTSEGLEELRRDDLVHLLEEMAVEVDYLGDRICFVRNEILQLKWENAKSGDWGEIAELVDSGWVDVETVQKECCIW